MHSSQIEPSEQFTSVGTTSDQAKISIYLWFSLVSD